MSRIYWDSMLFIYLLEGNATFGPKVSAILKEMVQRNDVLCTSAFSVGEILTGPRRVGSFSGADRVKQFFAGGAVDVLPFTMETADRLSIIRAATGVRPPDAIHLATAAVAQTDVFLTNDDQLFSLQIPGIKFIAGLDGRILGRHAP
jgi:predicted nucleic acid-binding protein